MKADKRKKGCPNDDCIEHGRRTYQKVEVNYCPECGTRLVYVCQKCFSEMEDKKNPNQCICDSCEAEKAAKKEKLKDDAKKAALKVGAFGKEVAVDALKDGRANTALKLGLKFAEGAMKKK